MGHGPRPGAWACTIGAAGLACHWSGLLAVAAQRLAYKRAVAEREAEPKENVEGVEVEEPQMDLQQVNQQSLA